MHVAHFNPLRLACMLACLIPLVGCGSSEKQQAAAFRTKIHAANAKLGFYSARYRDALREALWGEGTVEDAQKAYDKLLAQCEAANKEVQDLSVPGVPGAKELYDAYSAFLEGEEASIRNDLGLLVKALGDSSLTKLHRATRLDEITKRIAKKHQANHAGFKQAWDAFAEQHGLPVEDETSQQAEALAQQAGDFRQQLYDIDARLNYYSRAFLGSVQSAPWKQEQAGKADAAYETLRSQLDQALSDAQALDAPQIAQAGELREAFHAFLQAQREILNTELKQLATLADPAAHKEIHKRIGEKTKPAQESYGRAWRAFTLAHRLPPNIQAYEYAPPITTQNVSLANDKADAPQGEPVKLRVAAPKAGELWVNDAPSQQRGEARIFKSPPLTPGQGHYYLLQLVQRENGKAQVVRTKRIDVEPGKTYTVDLTKSEEGSASN